LQKLFFIFIDSLLVLLSSCWKFGPASEGNIQVTSQLKTEQTHQK